MILKLKRTPGIYLVGFMGSGKSTAGRGLARALGWRFADLDEDIESRRQLSIPEIFDLLGEAGFRAIEHECLRRRVRDVERGVPWVIAVGGGCFAQPANFDLIQQNGVSVWLDAPFEMIRSRLAYSTNRPLARDAAQLEALFQARKQHYEKADYRIEVGLEGSLGAVEAILRLPIF
jgi:shikimate kinase